MRAYVDKFTLFSKILNYTNSAITLDKMTMTKMLFVPGRTVCMKSINIIYQILSILFASWKNS